MKYDDPNRQSEDPDPRASQNHRTVVTNPIQFMGEGQVNCDNCERERKLGAEFFLDEWHQMCDLCLDALAYQLWLNGLGKKWKRRIDKRTMVGSGSEPKIIFTTNNHGDDSEECNGCGEPEQEFGYMIGLHVQHIQGVCIECWDALAYQLREQGYGRKKPIDRLEKQRVTVSGPPVDGMVTIMQQAFGLPVVNNVELKFESSPDVRGATWVGDCSLNYRYYRAKKELHVWRDDGRAPNDAVNFMMARGYVYRYIMDKWVVACPSEGLISHMLPGYQVTR